MKIYLVQETKEHVWNAIITATVDDNPVAGLEITIDDQVDTTDANGMATILFDPITDEYNEPLTTKKGIIYVNLLETLPQVNSITDSVEFEEPSSEVKMLMSALINEEEQFFVAFTNSTKNASVYVLDKDYESIGEGSINGDGDMAEKTFETQLDEPQSIYIVVRADHAESDTLNYTLRWGTCC